MTAVSPAPEGVEYFLDTRGEARALRVTWHHDSGLVVLSMWRGSQCVASFRLAVDEVRELIRALRAGLDDAYDAATHRGEEHYFEERSLEKALPHRRRRLRNLDQRELRFEIAA